MRFLLDLHTSGETSRGTRLDHMTSLRASSARRSASGLIYAFTGFAVVEGRMTDPSSEIPESLLRRALTDPGSVSVDMRGAVALLVFDPANGKFVVVNDAFGSCYLAVYRNGSHTVLATDVSLIHDHLLETGVSLRKSVQHVATMFTTGYGGLGSSPYEGVEMLDFGTWVEGGSGTLAVKELDLAPFVAEAQDLDYETGLHRTHSEISETFQALTGESGLTPIAQLTGGADSRVVFSFLLAQGMSQDYLYYCSGHPGETDRMTFESLARHYGLTASTGSGVSLAGMPASFEDELVGPLEYSTGLNTAGPTSDWIPTGNLILAGGYGETLRTMWGAPADEVGAASRRERLLFPWKGTLSPGGGTAGAYVSDEFIEHLAGSVDRIYQRGIDAGLSPDGALDLLYLTRARIFVGNSTYLHNDFVRRYDPLYSLRGAIFALTREFSYRVGNIICMDLIQRNAPDLLRLPFDSPRLTGAYADLRPVPERLDFEHADRPLAKGVPMEMPRNRPNVNYGKKPTPAQIEFARTKRASLRQVMWAEHVRENLRERVEAIDGSELASSFNVSAIQRELSRPFPNRVVIRNMLNLYALLQWHR